MDTRHVPWCKKSGKYELKQCYRDSCFCVNEHGVHRSGTKVQVSSGRVTCGPSGNI